MDYEKIETAIREASATQIPTLMIACIQAGIEKSVWRPYWISLFASRVEREARQAAAAKGDRCPRCNRVTHAKTHGKDRWYCHFCRMEFEPDDDGDIGYGPPHRRVMREER